MSTATDNVGYIELDPKDLTIDTCRPSPQGWILKADICVRITHNPTGISVSKCDDRSQHRNKANAYADLCAAVAKYLASFPTAIAQTQVRLYGCNGRQRPMLGAPTHFGQKGYMYAKPVGPLHNDEGDYQIGFTRLAIYVEICHIMSTECQYDKSATDKGCTNCQHRKV